MKLRFFFMNKNILNYLKLFVIHLSCLLLPYLFNLFVLIVCLFIYYITFLLQVTLPFTYLNFSNNFVFFISEVYKNVIIEK